MTGPLLRQIPEEFDRLLAIFRERQPKRILEVGVYEGGTLYQWITNAPTGALVVAVDLFEEEIPAAARKEFRGWRPTVKVRTVAGDSTDSATVELVRAFAPFDWVFIDASHRLEDATADWTHYGGMVEDGIVAFHDVSPHTRPGYWSDVPTLWDEIRRQSGYRVERIAAEPPQGWGGIGVVYVR